MKMNSISVIIAACCVFVANCAAIVGKLELPSYDNAANTRVKLVNINEKPENYMTAFIKQDGNFQFVDVGLGSYLLDVDNYEFIVDHPLIRIEVLPQSEEAAKENNVTIKAYEYVLGQNVNDLVNEIDYPIVIMPYSEMPTKSYYEEKDKGLAATGQLGVILSSPLLLGGVALVLVMLGLKQLITMIDPEAAALAEKGATKQQPAVKVQPKAATTVAKRQKKSSSSKKSF